MCTCKCHLGHRVLAGCVRRERRASLRKAMWGSAAAYSLPLHLSMKRSSRRHHLHSPPRTPLSASKLGGRRRGDGKVMFRRNILCRSLVHVRPFFRKRACSTFQDAAVNTVFLLEDHHAVRTVTSWPANTLYMAHVMPLPNLRRIFSSSRTDDQERAVSRQAFFRFCSFLTSCAVIALLSSPKRRRAIGL